jgi:ferredoxin
MTFFADIASLDYIFEYGIFFLLEASPLGERLSANKSFQARYSMAYKITDACVNCGACEPECPVQAISEKNGTRVIDENACTSCGSCAESCPVEAIIAG